MRGEQEPRNFFPFHQLEDRVDGRRTAEYIANIPAVKGGREEHVISCSGHFFAHFESRHAEKITKGESVRRVSGNKREGRIRAALEESVRRRAVRFDRRARQFIRDWRWSTPSSAS